MQTIYTFSISSKSRIQCVRAQLRNKRPQFLHNGEISIDSYDPAAFAAVQPGDANIRLDDFDYEVDRIAKLVLVVQEAVPIVLVLD